MYKVELRSEECQTRKLSAKVFTPYSRSIDAPIEIRFLPTYGAIGSGSYGRLVSMPPSPY